MITTVNFKLIKSLGACAEAIEWAKGYYPPNAKLKSNELIVDLMRHKKYSWANWLIVRLMDRPQYLSYAIFAAEEVLPIYEQLYPNDNRPRKAIEAAKAVLQGDSQANGKIAAEAAAQAAREAAREAAQTASWEAAAEAAAQAAREAAQTAAQTVSWEAAARAAAQAAAREAAQTAAQTANNAADTEKLPIKMLNYGVKLLMEGGK